MKIYEVEFSKDGLTLVQKLLDKLTNMFEEEKFRQFIANKCNITLNEVCHRWLTTLPENNLESQYMSAMHTEIKDDYIYLYNDAMVDINGKNMSSETKANYIGGLSLAEIVEYGIGYTGAMNTAHQDEIDDWQYDVNNHGYKGWYYKDDNGNIQWTNGYEGRLIFYKLKEDVLEHIEEWVAEYVNKELKG